MLTRKENKCSEQGPREQEELERCQENRLRQDLSSSESSHVIKTKEKKGKSSVPLRNPRFDWTRKPLALASSPLLCALLDSLNVLSRGAGAPSQPRFWRFQRGACPHLLLHSSYYLQPPARPRPSTIVRITKLIHAGVTG